MILLLLGCNCKDEVIVSSYRLNEFEKTLISYSVSDQLSFVSNEDDAISFSVVRKESEIEKQRHGPESCNFTEFEYEFCYIASVYKGLVVKLDLMSSSINTFDIVVSSQSSNNNGVFKLDCDTYYTETIEEKLTDITINQFEFQNVLVFQDCSESTEIERIIYSADNGLEFVEFIDGNWLKFNE